MRHCLKTETCHHLHQRVTNSVTDHTAHSHHLELPHLPEWLASAADHAQKADARQVAESKTELLHSD